MVATSAPKYEIQILTWIVLPSQSIIYWGWNGELPEWLVRAHQQPLPQECCLKDSSLYSWSAEHCTVQVRKEELGDCRYHWGTAALTIPFCLKKKEKELNLWTVI